jgi:hypothetical protein
MPTHSVDIFLQMVNACRRQQHMTPRSSSDKEYFAQDWFMDRLRELGMVSEQQGRNSYPDFWVGEGTNSEGYELKSLAFTKNRPARKDLDFNSTIPSGKKQGRDVFLVFILYTGAGARPRIVHSISLAHADFINSDHAMADEHLNVAIHQFGSYADGFIRDRKMYVFPHPISLNPGGLGRYRLIVPQTWNVRRAELRRVDRVVRTVAREAVDRYTIRLRGRGVAETGTVPYPNAGQALNFDVFEAT